MDFINSLNFLHNYEPSPLLFSFGFFQIYWYGFLMSLAMIFGILLAQKIGGQYGLNKEKIFDLSVYLILFGLLGARIYYVFLELNYFIDYPLNIFKVWEGGLAIHGAIIGGLVAGYIFTKKYKLNFFLVADITAVSLALGQAIGRWGNYFNKELYGGPTDLPWGIPISSFFNSTGTVFYHPAFLYESILNFFNFLFLLFLHKKRLLLLKEARGEIIDWTHISPGRARLNILSSGNIFLFYLMNYSLIRFLMEFVRTDETAMLFGFRVPQLLSFLLFILIVLILKYKIQRFKNSKI